MQGKIGWIALIALGLTAGCASEIDTSSSSLVAVDVDTMTAQTLYSMPEVSALPLTYEVLTERGLDISAADPVRVEVFENIAVAWLAPNGQVTIGRDSIVALWRVVPVADETFGDGAEAETRAPDESTVELVGSLDYVTEMPRAGDELEIDRSAAEEAILDFADRLGSPQELPMLEELATYHPGCI